MFKKPPLVIDAAFFCFLNSYKKSLFKLTSLLSNSFGFSETSGSLAFQKHKEA